MDKYATTDFVKNLEMMQNLVDSQVLNNSIKLAVSLDHCFTFPKIQYAAAENISIFIGNNLLLVLKLVLIISEKGIE